MAAAITHQFAAIGTNVFIQTGYFGGLSSQLDYSAILIVTEAKMEDGVTNAYIPGHSSVKADEELITRAVDYCQKKGCQYVTRSVLSTSAPFLETEKIVQSWSLDGHIGVDMESAVTLAVAINLIKKLSAC